jgi:hypothetical protein
VVRMHFPAYFKLQREGADGGARSFCCTCSYLTMEIKRCLWCSGGDISPSQSNPNAARRAPSGKALLQAGIYAHDSMKKITRTE